MRQPPLGLHPGQRGAQHHCSLDRADAGHQGRDAGPQVRAVFGIDRHDEKHIPVRDPVGMKRWRDGHADPRLSPGRSKAQAARKGKSALQGTLLFTNRSRRLTRGGMRLGLNGGRRK